MVSTLTWNSILVMPFLLAFIGIPLYMTFRHLDRAPDHSASHRYLAARAEFLEHMARRRHARAEAAAHQPRPLTVADVLRPLAPSDVTEDPELALAGRR